MKYDKKAKRYIDTWRTKCIGKGWQYATLLLPPEVKSKVMEYKNQLMLEYKQANIECMDR
jgi:hypothetical protein